MTAPFPSLTEQARIATHGMFDTEILTAMEEHADDVLPCRVAGCGNEIRWRFVQVCCGHSRVFCRWHKVQKLRALVVFLRAVDFLTCASCGALHVDPTVESTTRIVGL